MGLPFSKVRRKNGLLETVSVLHHMEDRAVIQRSMENVRCGADGINRNVFTRVGFSAYREGNQSFLMEFLLSRINVSQILNTTRFSSRAIRCADIKPTTIRIRQRRIGRFVICKGKRSRSAIERNYLT